MATIDQLMDGQERGSMKLILLMALTIGCSFRPELQPVITPHECKRACSPSGMSQVQALDGTCTCNGETK